MCEHGVVTPGDCAGVAHPHGGLDIKVHTTAPNMCLQTQRHTNPEANNNICYFI